MLPEPVFPDPELPEPVSVPVMLAVLDVDLLELLAAFSSASTCSAWLMKSAR